MEFKITQTIQVTGEYDFTECERNIVEEQTWESDCGCGYIERDQVVSEVWYCEDHHTARVLLSENSETIREIFWKNAEDIQKIWIFSGGDDEPINHRSYILSDTIDPDDYVGCWGRVIIWYEKEEGEDYQEHYSEDVYFQS